MKKEELSLLPIERRKLIAVSYLIREISERPKETEKLFKKLETLERSATQTNAAMQQAEVTINELNNNFMKIIGSLQTITEIIAEMLPDEKIDEWCDKYTPPKNLPKIPGSQSIPGNTKIVRPGSTDIAGVTAKQSE